MPKNCGDQGGTQLRLSEFNEKADKKMERTI